MNQFDVACIQLRTGNDVADNIKTVTGFIREAAAKGADYIITPETSHLMEMNSKRLFASTAFESEETAIQLFADLAAELKVWLHIGSLAIKLSDTKVANRAYVFSPEGKMRQPTTNCTCLMSTCPGVKVIANQRIISPAIMP